jgi:hypothetical protein
MTPGTSSGAASNQGSPSVAGSNEAGSASGTSNMGNSGQSSSSQLSTSTSGQGGLSKQEATPYIANFAMVDKNSDGNVSETEFQEGCQKGWVQAASSSGSGQSGSSPSSSDKSGG